MREIIIVDDHEPTRRLLRLVLERHGYDVAEADSEAGALQLLEERSAPHAAIFDLHIGTDSGVNLLQRLRADPIFVKLPVVFASAEPNRNAVIASASLGVVQFLTKPIDNARLRESVDRGAALNWMHVHFRSPAEIRSQKGWDAGTYRDMANWFFIGLAKAVSADSAERAKAGIGASISGLEQTARDLGLAVLAPAFAQWKEAGLDSRAPALLGRGAVLKRLFDAYFSAAGSG